MLNRATNEIGPHFPQNRQQAASKLRRDGKHCPVCLAPLTKNGKRTRLRRECRLCQARISPLKPCARCRALAIWENKGEAACQACGLHGAKRAVIAATK